MSPWITPSTSVPYVFYDRGMGGVWMKGREKKVWNIGVNSWEVKIGNEKSWNDSDEKRTFVFNIFHTYFHFLIFPHTFPYNYIHIFSPKQ